MPYEVNAGVPGLPLDAVPIIVHLLQDIAVGQTARLVLFDVETHAHRSEAAFRLGPSTQRFVLVTPEWCDRQAILVVAGVDAYCSRENDRCFVWHHGVRWQDTDHAQRRIVHGDYIRIALPPTERFSCATSQIVHWTQEGLTDAEILDQIVGPEVTAGYSPSLLDDDEIHELATTHIEDDSFLAMQRHALARARSTQ